MGEGGRGTHESEALRDVTTKLVFAMTSKPKIRFVMTSKCKQECLWNCGIEIFCVGNRQSEEEIIVQSLFSEKIPHF